ncbi:MAG TPA: hypothetical protein VFM38_12410 [Candidatus Limnocylindrales bacterium]|nr:hypothetical protein [Candidatus Limnocylindrales bacterium]
MRRIISFIGAVTLIGGIASATALAAGPPQKADWFFGDFDLLAGDTVIGHIHVTFTPPTEERIVPGTLDISWSPDAPADAFPFMQLEWMPVRESHAQLISGYFGIEPGYATIAGTGGYLCDYGAPWTGDCRPFGVHFDRPLDGSPNVMWWKVGDADEIMLGVGHGKFTLIYGYPTG